MLGQSTDLGIRKIKLNELFLRIDSVEEMSIDLTYIGKKGLENQGKVSFTYLLKPQAISQPVDAVGKLSASKAMAGGKSEPLKGSEKVKFTTGVIQIRQITCSSLKNVELMGKNDVFVEIEYLGETIKTITHENCGSEVDMKHLDMKWNVSEKDLILNQMRIDVYDANTLRNHVLIGSMDISLRSILPRTGSIEADGSFSEEIIQTDLFSSDGKTKTGHVSIFMKLMDTNSSLTTLPSDFMGYLRVVRLCIYEARYINATFSNQLVEPYAKVAIGSWFDWIAPGPKNQQGTVIFDHLDILTDITASMLQSTPITIELWDKQPLRNYLIGVGCIGGSNGSERASKQPSSHSPLLSAKIDSLIELPITLTSSNAISGRAVVYVKLEASEKAVYPSVSPSEFPHGTLYIKSIAANGLRNTEMFGKSDPYVKILHQTAEIGRTNVINNGGSSGFWDHLDYKCVMKHEDLKDGAIVFSVFDDNALRSDVLIG